MSPRPHAVRRALAAVPLVLLVPLAASCSAEDLAEKATEKTIEEAVENNGGGDVDVDIDQDGGGLSVDTGDGSFSSGGDLPEGFPTDDVPLVDGDVGFAIANTGGDGSQEAYSVTINAEGSADDVRTAVVDDLEAAGFTVVSDAGEAGAALESDAWEVFVIVVDGDPVTVQYAVTAAS